MGTPLPEFWGPGGGSQLSSWASAEAALTWDTGAHGVLALGARAWAGAAGTASGLAGLALSCGGRAEPGHPLPKLPLGSVWG